MGVTAMRDRQMTFTDKSRREVRVLFDPDGTALYCGTDLAAIMGYTSPGRAVQNASKGEHPAESVLREMEWENETKRGICKYRFFTEENAVEFLKRRPAPNDAMRWFKNEVIPQARSMSVAIAAERFRKTAGEPQEAAQPVEVVHHPPAASSSIMERLDAIILECALLKRELFQTR